MTCQFILKEKFNNVLKTFFKKTKKWWLSPFNPMDELLRPSALEYHSGLIGIPLKARAKSYQKNFNDSDYISNVVFYYALIDNPSADDWYYLASDCDIDDDQYYIIIWTNNINDNKVWICAQAEDDGMCESLPVSLWIKIDSTKPTVTNTQP